MTDPKELIALIEDAVDQGATSVEEIHRRIAELPLRALEQPGLLERTTQDVRSIQDASIGAVYDAIRDVNHEVAKLAGELLAPTARRQQAVPSDGAEA